MIDVVDTATPVLALDLADGTGAGQANAYWKGVITISAGATGSVDLRALPLEVFGGSGTLSLASVKMLLVVNTSTTASVAVGVSATNRWAGRSADLETVGPSGVVYAVNGTGWATTTSSKLLAITNNGATTATVQLYVAGVKA